MPSIYQTSSLGEAQLRAALVSRGDADLLVHRVASRSMAHRDTLWYITRNRQEADVLIFFASPGMAQLKICFVESIAEAGWQKRRPPGIRL